MKAGRELDCWIAENVFGWIKVPAPEHWSCCASFAYQTSECNSKCEANLVCPDCTGAPLYSTDIADAWLVVEKMHELGWCFDLMDMRHSDESPGWWYELTRYEEETNEQSPFYGGNVPVHYWQLDGYAETAPLAICLAAKAAMEAKI